MEFKILLIFLLSHLSFDFVFQGKFIINKRFPNTKDNSKKWLGTSVLGNLIHAIFHIVGIYIIIVILNFFFYAEISNVLLQVVIIGIVHFIIDEIKSIIIKAKPSEKDNIWIFLLDQVLHLVTLILVMYKLNFHKFFGDFNNKVVLRGSTIDENFLMVLIILALGTFATGIFIKIFITHLSRNDVGLAVAEVNSKDIVNINGEVLTKPLLGAKNGGMIIGILERVFIIISIAINFPMMIGFILTVKSIARLKKLSNDGFAEYFIIGNFLSFIPAIILGLSLKFILKI